MEGTVSMFKNFFLRRAQKRRELRGQLVDTLLHRLERESSLVVDDGLIAQMGVKRRVFFQVVYGLVIQERMHMMADDEGCVILMTNAEFHRFMLRRAGVQNPEMRLLENSAVFANEEDTIIVDAVAAELATLTVDHDSLIPMLDEMDSTLVAATLGGAPMSGLVPEQVDDVIEPLPQLSARGTDPAARESRKLRKPTRQLQLAGPQAEAEGDLNWFDLDVTPTLATREKLPDTRQSLPDRPREPWLINDNKKTDLE